MRVLLLAKAVYESLPVASRTQDTLTLATCPLARCQADATVDVGRRKVSPRQSRTTLQIDWPHMAPAAGRRPRLVGGSQMCRKPRSMHGWLILRPSCAAKVLKQCASNLS